MTFMVTFSLTPDSFEARMARFADTGGLPPEGVQMLGRWHAADASRGFVLCSSDDTSALYRWIADWADLIEFQTTPVLTDEELSAVMQSMQD